MTSNISTDSGALHHGGLQHESLRLRPVPGRRGALALADKEEKEHLKASSIQHWGRLLLDPRVAEISHGRRPRMATGAQRVDALNVTVWPHLRRTSTGTPPACHLG